MNNSVFGIWLLVLGHLLSFPRLRFELMCRDSFAGGGGALHLRDGTPFQLGRLARSTQGSNP
jgi:hypothetical protein